ncbi:MAG: RNA polymerase factor sigma-54 [Candidatus Jidaibacter sp.]|nr:RNA polymerase factor sigma-54 [Candidatus Jidaibacter sp.]
MFDQKLSLKGAQALVLSKQMQQSLKILQMTSVELSEYVAQQYEVNPFIDVENTREDSIASSNQDNDNQEIDNAWESDSYLRYESRSVGDGYASIENLRDDRKSLKEHLIEQVNICFGDSKERAVACYITDTLDANGYISETIDQIASALNVKKKFVEAVLSVLQTFDPVGVYAVDLKSCLTIQALEKYSDDTQLISLIENLEMIAKGEFSKISKTIGCSLDKVRDLIKMVQKLEPKPGRNFAHEVVKSRVADAFIVEDHAGIFYARLNTDVLPKVFVNSKYFAKISETTRNISEKRFCADQFQSANWLLKSIYQRSETIIKIADRIAKEQRDFFKYGLDYLKPMTLSDIAAKIGMHESTISRVSNKFLSTPRGVYEIKYFFTNALTSNVSDDLISTKSVQQKLKEIVESEKADSKTFSDDELAERLHEIGINISRRTVAKYRTMLNIAPSHIRKRRLEKFLSE